MDKNAVDNTEDSKTHIAGVTEHVMDDAHNMVSMDTFCKAETFGASSVSIGEQLSIESTEVELVNDKVIQGHDKGSSVHALCSMEGSKIPCLQVQEPALIEPRHVQNTALTYSSSMEKTLATHSVIDTDNWSIESTTREKNDHQHDDLAADKKAPQGLGMDGSKIIYDVTAEAPQGLGMDGSKIIYDVTADEDSIHIVCTGEDLLQEHGIKINTGACGVMGGDDLNNFASKDACTDAEILVEQSRLILNGKKNAVEENEYQHSCVVPPSDNEDDNHTCVDLPCCETISNQEKMSFIHLETELHGSFDDSLSMDELIERDNLDFEMGVLVEDTEHKAGGDNALRKDLENAQFHHHLYNVTDTLSPAESCEQRNCSLKNENLEAGDSCSLTEAIQDEDAKHNVSVVSESTCSCLKASDSNGGPSTLSLQDDEEHVNENCIAGRFLNTEDRALSTAQVTESDDLWSRQNICDNILEGGSTEPQRTATDVKSDDDSTSGSLKGITCGLDTLNISNLAHKESAGDEECQLTAGQDSSIKCFSPSSLITCSVIAQVRDIGDHNTFVHCSEDNKLLGMDLGMGQTEEGTASNESQLRGYTVDKDGGSSLDSTAGTEWEPQGTDECITVEDEEASNTGVEDSATSPACLQPSTQQRKKINRNHQFVREIVKIQHDREQYDREQTERQIQAQQAAASAQPGGKNLDAKGRKVHTLDPKQLRNELGKISSQKGPNDHGDDRQIDSQQKHATRISKSVSVQAKAGSSNQKNVLQENTEHERQGQGLLGAKEHGKTGRGRQHRSMSIYRPPVVRDTLAARESETSNQQSVTYMMNSSPDSSTSSVPDLHVPIVGSPSLFGDEGILKITRSSSGESYAPNRETQTEQGKPGMGIKVTFDTERKQRHIEYSAFSRGHAQSDQVSLAASHSSSGFGVSKSPIISPLLSYPSQESKSSLFDKRQAGLGEASSKANDRYFTQADRSSSLQGSFSSESSHFQGKKGKGSGNSVERKTNFSEQADNNVILHNSSTWLHTPPPLAHHGNIGGQNTYSDYVRQSEAHAGDMRTSNAMLHGFNTPNFNKSFSLGPSYKGDLLSAISHSSPYMQSDEPIQTLGNFQARLLTQQFNVSRSKHDSKGKQRFDISSDGSKKKRDLQLRNSIKESGSPFQTMMKDTNRSQVMYSSPAPHLSGNSSSDKQGFGMSWELEDRMHSHNQDSSYEGLKRTQSDASRKGSTQNLQAQSSSLPLRESFFSTMPMQEKWGDIVDDQYDPYDYLHVEREVEREGRAGNLSYGNNSQNDAAFSDAASLKPEKYSLRDSRQNKTSRKYGYSETGSSQKNKVTSELLQGHSAYEFPARKSVFERLGPQNVFKESILGPPPKVSDSRGVLRASPDVIVSNGPSASAFRSFDTGSRGSQQAAHVPGMLHDMGDNINDEGREVVVQAYTELKQRRSKRELYVPRRGS